MSLTIPSLSLNASVYNASTLAEFHPSGISGEKHIGYILGEHVLRPLIDRVGQLSARTWSALVALDRAFTLPIAEAAPVPPSKLHVLRERIEMLSLIELTEDMIARAINDEPGSEPALVLFIKDCISVLATIADPSEFYNNLVLGELEAHVRGKIEMIRQGLEKHQQVLKTHEADKLQNQQKQQVRQKIASRETEKTQKEAEAASKTHSIQLVQKELEDAYARAKPYAEHIRTIRKSKEAISADTDRLTSQAMVWRTGGLISQAAYNDYLEATINPAIDRNNERTLQLNNEERFYASLLLKENEIITNLEAHIKTLTTEKEVFKTKANALGKQIRDLKDEL